MLVCLCMHERQGVGKTLGIKNTGPPVMHPMILCFLILSHRHLLQHGTKAELVCAASAFHDAKCGIVRAL